MLQVHSEASPQGAFPDEGWDSPRVTRLKYGNSAVISLLIDYGGIIAQVILVY